MQRPDPRCHPGERLAAGRFGIAVRERLVQGVLRVASGEERQPHVGRRDTIEHDRPHVLAVLPEIDERRARAVRPAVKIDAVVPEDRANIVQIVHRDVCRVQANVGVVAIETPAKASERGLTPLGHLAQRAGTGPAVQRVGLSGSALIDQHDVAGPLNLTEDAADLTGQLGRGLAGSAGEKEQRIVTCRRSKRRKHDNPEADLTSNSGVAVFEDRHGPAQRVGRSLAARARDEGGQAIDAIRSCCRPPRRASGAGKRPDHSCAGWFRQATLLPLASKRRGFTLESQLNGFSVSEAERQKG